MDKRDVQVAEATIKWIRVWRAVPAHLPLKPLGGDELPTTADVQHSSLLKRLLRGHDPLPDPPPLSFGYPDYTTNVSGVCPECGDRVYFTGRPDVYGCSNDGCDYTVTDA